jgi:hypothetical protein
MASTPWAVTFDCRDGRRLGLFWALALGYVEAPPPDGASSWDEWYDRFDVPDDERDVGAIVDPEGQRPAITFLPVPEDKVVKNRVHLDVRVSGGRTVDQEVRERRIEDRVALLVDAGGSVLRRDDVDGRLDHVVMQDPEGDEFCVV